MFPLSSTMTSTLLRLESPPMAFFLREVKKLLSRICQLCYSWLHVPPFMGISQTLFCSYIRCALAICRLEDINLVMVMRRCCHYYFIDEIFMVSVQYTIIDQLEGLICRYSYVDE